MGFQHLTVNHTLNFVDLVTSAHTQNVLNSWENVKSRNKNNIGQTHRTMINSYLCLRMGMRKRNHNNDLFDNNIINAIVPQYINIRTV